MAEHGGFNFLDLLEEPGFGQQAAFQSRVGGLRPNLQRFYRNQFSNIQNRYLGQLGGQITSGSAPTLRFQDFLGNFDFQNNFRSLPPGLAGRNTGRFAPQIRSFF